MKNPVPATAISTVTFDAQDYEETHQFLRKHVILQTTVGSRVHGLHPDDGTEDEDQMAIVVEPLEVSGVSLHDRFSRKGFSYRTAVIRERRENVRSRAGDLDLVYYGLRKFVHLALKSNPTVLIPLFSQDHQIITLAGQQLQDLASKFVSQECYGAFRGYMHNQRERLEGRRGGKDVNRPELVERYGFDTKYAMHACRLAFQGTEILSTGRLSLPMKDEPRTWLLRVRRGEIPLAEVIEQMTDLESNLESAKKRSPLQKHPNTFLVQEWMLKVYFDAWEVNYRLRYG